MGGTDATAGTYPVRREFTHWKTNPLTTNTQKHRRTARKALSVDKEENVKNPPVESKGQKSLQADKKTSGSYFLSVLQLCLRKRSPDTGTEAHALPAKTHSVLIHAGDWAARSCFCVAWILHVLGTQRFSHGTTVFLQGYT